MQTQFCSVSVAYPDTPCQFPQAVEDALALHGSVLRWAIVAVDAATQTVTVEAVITTDDPPPSISGRSWQD